MIVDRRSMLGAMSAVIASPCQGTAPTDRVFTPEMFGAKGDGVSNDTEAMAAMARAVTLNGGGTVEFRRTTYIVGRQALAPDPRAPFTWEPATLLAFVGCHRPLIIRGHGARIKCADGLKFGTFHRDGSVMKHAMPYAGTGRAAPYDAMINILNCRAAVEVSDLELDGNLPRLVIGGEYGDTGWQIHALGLALFNNAGPEVVRNIHTHHHAQDGLYIDGLDTDAAASVQRVMSGVVSEFNGRQGCSIAGGISYVFERCKFAHTGRGGLYSAPGAGVDIEAENKRIRGLRFIDCEFSDNTGCGLVADSGDSADIGFSRCKFVGTTNWSAWPNKPNMTFSDCTFVGAIVRAYGDQDRSRAAKFLRCAFLDDPSLSPTGKIYGGVNSTQPLADLGEARNVLFEACRFLATHGGVLPWSTHAIYSNCIMKQRVATTGFPRGTFAGTSRIDGAVDLYGSQISGALSLNGKLLTRVHL